MSGSLTSWRRRRALRTARLLDQVVDRQLSLLAGLSEQGRRRSADYLAELVMLAQTYRHYANGWIDHRELNRQGEQTLRRLDNLRQPRPTTTHVTEQVTEQD